MDFGGGQGGEACASPQRDLKAKPIPRCETNPKRRAEGPLSIFRQALGTPFRVALANLGLRGQSAAATPPWVERSDGANLSWLPYEKCQSLPATADLARLAADSWFPTAQSPEPDFLRSLRFLFKIPCLFSAYSGYSVV